MQPIRVVRLDDNETRISGARRADCHRLWCTAACVEELVLPKSVEIGNLSLNKAVIRWMLRIKNLRGD
jgi:hypothetical protein